MEELLTFPLQIFSNYCYLTVQMSCCISKRLSVFFTLIEIVLKTQLVMQILQGLHKRMSGPEI